MPQQPTQRVLLPALQLASGRLQPLTVPLLVLCYDDDSMVLLVTLQPSPPPVRLSCSDALLPAGIRRPHVSGSSAAVLEDAQGWAEPRAAAILLILQLLHLALDSLIWKWHSCLPETWAWKHAAACNACVAGVKPCAWLVCEWSFECTQLL
jgi:hypothetical protein